MVLNPDVVVRSRGRDGEVQPVCAAHPGGQAFRPGSRDGRWRTATSSTACQQACPAQAIVFGDLADPDSRVARLARSPRHYHLLADLGTRPSVGYLTKVRRTQA